MSKQAAEATLLDNVPDIEAANVVRCARVLLRRPLLSAGGPDGDLLPMIYRHRTVLQELFSSLLGYRLVVQRRFARLYKAGPGADASRGEPSMSPRSYAYLALTLAAMTGIGRQVLLSRLVIDVRAAAVEAGMEVTDDQADRRAITAALRHLVALGVITETEGTVTPLATDSTAEALITIDTDLMGQLLAGPLAEAANATELISLAGRQGPRGAEHAVRRRLVEDPIVLFCDLPADQAAWLRENQAAETTLLERFFGLVAETRVEGMVASDPEDYLTDIAFPGTSTVARIALLSLPPVLDRAHLRDEDSRLQVSEADIRAICEEIVESYPAAWSRQATEDLDELVRAVTALLQRLDILRFDSETGFWLVSPATYRWLPQPDATPAAAREPEPPPPPPPSWSLFDDEEDEH